jgi:CubicO group peptidase (beta-lactamase class C family)
MKKFVTRQSGTATLKTVLLLLIAVLSFASPVLAQSGKISPEKKAKIETAVAKFMAAHSIPGISVAVVENGEYEWSSGFGMADLENYVPATSQTLYRLASISKPITATAAMLLWQQKKLDLDAPVQKYCPAFPLKEAPITTRQVLGHLAGIRHYKSDSQDDSEVGNTKHFENPIKAGLDFFQDDPLLDKPGVAFHYSTHGYTLAGCVIEGASGAKYVDYVQENVLRPAGMTHTQIDNRYAVIPFRTRFYQKDKTGSVVNADFLDSTYKVPGGGWLSSVEDMAKFEVALLRDRILERTARDRMWTSLKTADGKETGYGLGWGSGKDLGFLTVGHSGGQQGTSTDILLAPERQSGVVVLMNLEGGDASKLANELLEIVLGMETTKAK